MKIETAIRGPNFPSHQGGPDWKGLSYRMLWISRNLCGAGESEYLPGDLGSNLKAKWKIWADSCISWRNTKRVYFSFVHNTEKLEKPNRPQQKKVNKYQCVYRMEVLWLCAWVRSVSVPKLQNHHFEWKKSVTERCSVDYMQNNRKKYHKGAGRWRVGGKVQEGGDIRMHAC